MLSFALWVISLWTIAWEGKARLLRPLRRNILDVETKRREKKRNTRAYRSVEQAYWIQHSQKELVQAPKWLELNTKCIQRAKASGDKKFPTAINNVSLVISNPHVLLVAVLLHKMLSFDGRIFSSPVCPSKHSQSQLAVNEGISF